jgi:hypothetical protein
MARVYETFIVLCLLAVVVLGLTYVMSALIDQEQSCIHTFLSKLSKTFHLMAFYFIFNFILCLLQLTCFMLQIFGVTTYHFCIHASHFLVCLCCYVSNMRCAVV